MKKVVLFLVLLMVMVPAWATDWYFDSDAGSDSYDGLYPEFVGGSNGPKQTISALQTVINGLSPGDRVFLKRGSVWWETEISFQSIVGTALNPIEFKAYGTGDMPVLSGEKVLGAASATDGNIYIYDDSDIPPVNIDVTVSRGYRFPASVTIDSTRTPISREPDDSYYVASGMTNGTITDTEGWTVDEWIDGWASVKLDDWFWSDVLITDNTSTVLTTTQHDDISYGSPAAGKYYYLLGGKAACDQQDEWASKEDTLWIYSATGEPTTVMISIVDTIVNLYQSDYIEFDSIEFRGANIFGAHVRESDYIKFDYCKFKGMGTGGTFFWGTLSGPAGPSDTEGCEVTNSEFEDCLSTALHHAYAEGLTLTGNYFHRCGIQNGYQNIVTTQYGSSGSNNYTLAVTNSTGSFDIIIRNNFFDSIASALISHYHGNDIYVEDNFIRNYGMTELNDLAALYAVSDPSGSERKFGNNIILDVHWTAADALEDPGFGGYWGDDATFGVYFDQDTYDYKADSNSIENCTSALFTNGGRRRRFKDNNIFDPGNAYIYGNHKHVIHHSYSIQLQNHPTLAGYDTISGNTIVWQDSTAGGYGFFRSSSFYSCQFPLYSYVDNNDYFDPKATGSPVARILTNGFIDYSDNLLQWAARTISCPPDTYDPGNLSSFSATAFTKIYLLKNFDDDPWSAPIAGGSWQYADGSAVGSTVTVPPFYSVFIMTTDVTPTVINDLNIDSTLVPMLAGGVTVPSGPGVHQGTVYAFIDGSQVYDWIDDTRKYDIIGTGAPAVEAGTSQTICCDDAAALTGMYTSMDSILWRTSGTGTFDNDESASTNYNASAADTVAGSVTLTLWGYYGATPDSLSDALTLTLFPLPVLSAGDDDTISFGNTHTVDDAYAWNTDAIDWNTLGTGTFDDDEIIDPTYTYSAADSIAGYADLVLTGTSAYCDAPANDTTRVVLEESAFTLNDTAAVTFSISYSGWTQVVSGQTGVSINAAEGWTLDVDNSDDNGSNGYWPGPYPDQVCDGYIYTASGNGNTQVTIDGLDDAAEYDIDILLSRESISARVNTVTAGDASSQNIDVADNTTVLEFTEVHSTSGSMTITAAPFGGATFTYMNALIIREYTSP